MRRYEETFAEEGRALGVVIWFLGALAVVAGVTFAALCLSGTAKAADCAYTLDQVLPLLKQPGTVISDPDTVKAFVEAERAKGFNIPDGVTRVLVAHDAAGKPAFGVELGGCLTPPMLIDPGDAGNPV